MVGKRRLRFYGSDTNVAGYKENTQIQKRVLDETAMEIRRVEGEGGNL